VANTQCMLMENFPCAVNLLYSIYSYIQLLYAII